MVGRPFPGCMVFPMVLGNAHGLFWGENGTCPPPPAMHSNAQTILPTTLLRTLQGDCHHADDSEDNATTHTHTHTHTYARDFKENVGTHNPHDSKENAAAHMTSRMNDSQFWSRPRPYSENVLRNTSFFSGALSDPLRVCRPNHPPTTSVAPVPSPKPQRVFW